jgi:hypothetical protein
VESVIGRFRNRLLPALLLAIGVALVATGILSYTNAVEPAPVARALQSYEPLPTIDPNLTLPGGATAAPDPSFPPDRLATRIIIRRLGIDLPIIAQPPGTGDFPLCDVAMYLPSLGQPGSGRATYLYAHARTGMFLPLLTASQTNNGKKMIGYTVEVYTSDSWRFLYTISEVRRHTRDLVDAINDNRGRLWLQTSEGPDGTIPKLQVVAEQVGAERTDPVAAHPEPHPRQCH